MTQTGLSLGTPSYMSPEQAMGERTIDARSDLYALDAVTYEMLVGEAPFTGATVQAIVAKVLSAEPQSPTLIRNTIPPYVEGAVLKALAKLPADRWAKASDFAAALTGESPATQYVARTNASQSAAARTPSRVRALFTLTTIVAVAATSGVVWFATRKAPTPVPARFDVLLPDSVVLYNVSGRRLALSNDGTQLVVVATKGDTTRLYLRRIDETEFRPLAGTERNSYVSNVDPAFSPDGRSILFRASKALMRIPVAGGRAERIGPNVTASWGEGDRIVWVSSDTLWKIESSNAAKAVLAVFDAAATRRTLTWPSMLPGGHYALVSVSARGQQADDDHIGVISIDDGRVEDLGIVGTNAQYSSVRFAEAWVFDTTDGTTHKLFNEEASVGDPELSPDGRLVTYTLRSGTRRGLFVRPFASAGVPSVVVDGYVDFHRWSDDGRSIYFVRANRTIEVVDVNAAGEPLGPPRIVVPTSTLEAMRDDYLKARFTLIPGTRELYVSLNNQRAHGLVVLQNFEAFAVRVR